MTNRIAFFGTMCSGKTYLAQHLVNAEGWQKLAFADKLKVLAKDLFDVEGKNGPAREIYQQLGDLLRQIDLNVWVKAVEKKIDSLEEFWGADIPIVIDDVRYANEYHMLKDRGFMMVRVFVPDEIRHERIWRLYPDTDALALKHISEISLKDFKGDHEILSDSPEALKVLEDLLWPE